MPAQHAGTARANSFASLQLPSDETAYSRLSRGKQAALATALRGVDCAHPPVLTGTDDRVVCDEEAFVYLLGAPLFTADDVVTATPIEPSLSTSSQWKIALSLKSSAGDKVFAWTSQYHVDAPNGVYTVNQTSSRPPCGADARTPCSDFLAYLSGAKIVSVPLIAASFKTAVLVEGDFDEVSATRLARKITG